MTLFLLQTYFTNYYYDFESEDWSNFQHSLRIIQTLGDLIIHIEEFDGNVLTAIIISVGHLHTTGLPKDGAGHIYTTKKSELHAKASLFLSSSDDVEALVALVSSLQEGK